MKQLALLFKDTGDSKKYIIFLSILVFFTFFINTFHAEFPDEYDNIVGGYYINQGMLPYKDFFSHHGPSSYYLASIITLISHRSFITFRILLSFVYFGFIVLTYFILKRRVKTNYSVPYWLFALILGLASTYYWNQMLLADTLSGYLLIPVYGILLLKAFFGEKLKLKDLIVISIFSALTFLTSITYIYAVCIALAFTAFQYFLVDKNKLFTKDTVKFILIFILPYIVFFLYLLVTGSVKVFYQQAILYNKNTYIYNYPRPEGSTTINPLRYAIVITYNFFDSYRALLTQVKDFNFMFPFNITLAVVNLSLIITLIVKKKYNLALFILLTIIFTNPRSNPLNSKETDFQSAVYITLSLFNIPLVIKLITDEVERIKPMAVKLITSALYLILAAYLFFFMFYISNIFFTKVYLKYMGLAPLIYNNPQVAQLTNQLVKPDEYLWVGPLEFKEYLYSHALLPSKYHWFLRAHSVTPSINEEFIANISKNKPVVIIYKRDTSEFGNDPSSINSKLLKILSSDYFQVNDIEGYTSNFNSRDFSLPEHFYFRKDMKDELISRLLNANAIRSQ